MTNQIKEFEKHINVIHLYGLGEPMVNSELPYFVSRIKEEKVAKEVSVTSNGALLSKRMSTDLIEAKLDRLNISLNRLSDNVFLRITGASVNFEKLYEDLIIFLLIKLIVIYI